MSERADIASLTGEELTQVVLAMGQPSYRARQLADWLGKGIWDLQAMTNLPASFLKMLEEQTYLPRPVIERKLVSTDGTVKYLFRFADGELVETVLMNYRHGTSVCLSTQAGCRQGCAFCASTLGGLNRNLTASEILAQFFTAQRDSQCKISNIVLMGTGEPLDNFDHTVRFLQLVNAPQGPNIGMRHISLSTCGLVPQIRQLGEMGFPLTLSVSLHATTDELRDRLMPVNRKYPLPMLMQTCKEYFDKRYEREQAGCQPTAFADGRLFKPYQFNSR